MASEMMMGIDASKKTLVIDDGLGGTEIANAREAIDAWLSRLPTGSRLGIEATGGYHQRLAVRARQADGVVNVLNPRNLRHYAQGIGRRGKTDRVDATVIRRMVLMEHDGLRPMPLPVQE